MKKASVYCKNLDMFVRSEDLFAFFSQLGYVYVIPVTFSVR